MRIVSIVYIFYFIFIKKNKGNNGLFIFTLLVLAGSYNIPIRKIRKKK